MTIGEEIRYLREAKKMTREELAQAISSNCGSRYWKDFDRKIPAILNCSPEAVKRWEEGKILPQIDTLEALANALKLNPRRLLDRWYEKRRREYASRQGRKWPPNSSNKAARKDGGS